MPRRPRACTAESAAREHCSGGTPRTQASRTRLHEVAGADVDQHLARVAQLARRVERLRERHQHGLPWGARGGQPRAERTHAEGLSNVSRTSRLLRQRLQRGAGGVEARNGALELLEGVAQLLQVLLQCLPQRLQLLRGQSPDVHAFFRHNALNQDSAPCLLSYVVQPALEARPLCRVSLGRASQSRCVVEECVHDCKAQSAAALTHVSQHPGRARARGANGPQC